MMKGENKCIFSWKLENKIVSNEKHEIYETLV